MTVSTFTDAQAAFGFFGYFDELTDGTQRRWQTDDCTWTGYVTGTDCRLWCTTGAGAPPQAPFTVSVDGGAETSPATSAHPGFITLFSGLTDTPHLVRLRGATGFAPSHSRTMKSGTVLEVTGAAPAIGQGSDMGTSWLLNDPAFPGMHSVYLGALPTGNVRPLVNYTTNTAPGNYSRTGAVLFKTNCDSIWAMGGSSEFFLSIDGAAPTRITLAQADSAIKQWRKVIGGLDTSQAHEYMLVTSQAAGGTGALRGVMIGSSSAVFSALPVRSRIIQFGDSITESANSASVRSGNMDLWKIAPQLGLMPHAAGKGGQTAAGLNTDMASIIAALPAIPTNGVLAIGRNDVSGAAFRTSYTAIINAMLAAGITKIVCRRITPDNANTYQGTLDADIQTVVASFANPNIVYIGDNTWIGVSTTEGNGGTDGANPSAVGTHPDRAGYVTMANFELPAYRAFFASRRRLPLHMWLR